MEEITLPSPFSSFWREWQKQFSRRAGGKRIFWEKHPAKSGRAQNRRDEFQQQPWGAPEAVTLGEGQKGKEGTRERSQQTLRPSASHWRTLTCERDLITSCQRGSGGSHEEVQ